MPRNVAIWRVAPSRRTKNSLNKWRILGTNQHKLASANWKSWASPMKIMMPSEQSRRPRIRFLQQQSRKVFVFVDELFDVILNLNTRMDKRPKMSGSNKSKKR